MSQTPLSKHLLDPAMLDGVLSIEGYLRPSLRGRGGRLKKLASGSRPAGWSSSGRLSKSPSQSGCIEAWTPAWLGACTKGTRNTSTTITTTFTWRASTRRILYGATGSSTRRQPRLGRRACRGANALDGQCSPRVGTFRVTTSFPTPTRSRAAPTQIVRSPSSGISPRTGKSEWGGALYWCPRGVYLPPVFNTLVLFNVGPDTEHFVTQVSPFAQGKRLAINGWWTGPASTGKRVVRAPDQIDTGGVPIESIVLPS